MKTTISLFLLITAWTSHLIAQGHEVRQKQLDVQHYQFGITLSDESDEIQGDAGVRIKFLKTTTEFNLDLTSENESGKGMKVSAVTLQGKPLEFSQEGELLTIKVAEALKAGETADFRIQYAGIPADGLIIAKNMYGNRTFFGDNWPNRAHNWLPLVDHPSDKATVEFIITAPEHYQAVANGRLIERSNLEGDLIRTHWQSARVLPTKVMVIGVAEFATALSGRVANGKQGPVDVTAWVYPENRGAGFYDYDLAVPILKYYTELVAPYPYEKLANVQSKTRYGGMENAGCIFYNEGSVDSNRTSEGLIAHEIVHQWFGNSASEANWHHIWLSEGFATYLTQMYFQDTHGEEKFRERMEEDRKKVVNWPGTKQSPIVDTRITDWNMLLNPNSYQKGGWVLHMLRQKIGDMKFKEGLVNYYKSFHLSNAITEDFQKAMEDACGYSLTSFFKQWIYRAGHPELVVSWEHKKGKVKLTVTQKQDGEPFIFPLEIGFLVPGAKKMYVKNYNIEAKEHEFTFELEQTPSVVVLDPEVKLLFEGTVKAK